MEAKMARKTRIFVLLVVLFGFLIVARALAPVVVASEINRQLDKLNGIDGHVETVDLNILAGGYSLNNLSLFLQENKTDVPTVYLESVDLSILWSAIFRGEIVAEAHVIGAELSFTDKLGTQNGLTDEVKQSETWLTLIDFASPINIDVVTIQNSSLRLYSLEGEETRESFISNINGEINNITNSRSFTGDKIAQFDLTGSIMGKASTKLYGSLDPDSKKPTFDINLQMEKLNIVQLDTVVDTYTPVDIEDGTVDVALEIKATNGAVKGYLKAGVYEPNIFSWKEDIERDDDGILTGIFEGLSDLIVNIFESGNRDLVAINLAIEGELDDPNVSTLDAIVSLFYNAFIQEYDIKLEDSVS
jgi:hypothetical protein